MQRLPEGTIAHGAVSCSRRQMLRLLGLGSAGMLAAACAPAAPQIVKETVVVKEEVPVKETVVVMETSTVKETVVVEPTSAMPTLEEGELKILVCCYSPPEVDLRTAFNTGFMEKNPGIKLNMELLPSGQNYFEKLQTIIAAGTPPDLFDMWEGYVQPYAANGVLRNLDPFFEQDDKVKKSDVLPAAMEGGGYQGSVYAFSIGFMPGPASIYYNADHFEKAGIAPPSADWTWDNLRDAAKKMVVLKSDGKPERWGLVFDLWFVPWLYWIWSNGGDVFNADQTKCTLTEPKATQALQYWADVVNVDGSAIPTGELQAMQGSINAFQTGLVSMFLGNCWDVGTLEEASKQGLNWKAVLSPKANDENRTWYEHFWCWSMSNECKLPNAAWLYVRDFILNRTIDPATPTIPPLKQLLYTFANERNSALGYDPLVSLATQPNKFRIPGSGAKWDKISQIIQAELDLVYTGEKTAEAAAAACSPKVDEELARP